MEAIQGYNLTGMNALIVEDNVLKRKLFSINLHLYAGLNIHFASSMDEAEKVLSKNQSYEIIFAKTGKDDWSQKLQKKIQDRSLKTAVIGIVDVGGKESNALENQLKHIVRYAAKKIGVTSEKMASLVVPDYFPLSEEFFISGTKTPVQIFIKTKKGFEVFYQPGDTLSLVDMEEVKSNRSGEFYLKQWERLKFAQHVSQQLLEMLKENTEELGSEADVLEQIQNLTHEQARSMGVDGKVLNAAREGVKVIVQKIEDNHKLNVFLSQLTSKTKSYKMRQTYLTSYLCYHIISEMGRDMDLGEKLSYAAFMMDLALSSDELAKVKFEEDIPDECSIKDARIIKNHAQMAADFLKEVPDVPDDVVTVVRQHHGSRSGQHMKSPEYGLHPLSCIFIIAETWSHFVLNYADRPIKLSPKKVMNHLMDSYPGPQFQKVIKACAKLHF